MAIADPPVPPPAAERSERLALLVYELLDAHSDTERLVLAPSSELQWRVHLSYLQDLQRLGREILAEPIR
jgi:hypothetical protein